jgi:hypothetical protein
MKTSEFLKRAWGKIDHRDKWVRNHYQHGARYCMVGALDATLEEAITAMRESGGEYTVEMTHELRNVYHRVYSRLVARLGSAIEVYNDSHTWEQLRDRVLAELNLIEAEEQPPLEVELQPEPAFLKPQQPKVVRATQSQPQPAERKKELA